MNTAFIMFTSNLVNPMMAFSSGLAYLHYKNIDVDMQPVTILCKRREHVDIIHQNNTEYTEEYVFGKTVDDVVDLPTVLQLLQNYDNDYDILNNIHINDYRGSLLDLLDEYVERLKHKDVVFFSVFRYHFLYHLILAYKLKKLSPNIKIVFGGPQIQLSELTRNILEKCNFIDNIIVGDVETGLYDYLTDSINTKTYYPKDLNLNELQMPIYNMHKLFIYNKQIMMHTSRNCFNKCAYCPSVSLKYRKMPLTKFNDWIKYYCKTDINSIYLTDAILNPTPQRFGEIIEILLRHTTKQSYYIWCHSMGLDENIMKMLSGLSFRDPGCLVIAYDIVSNGLKNNYSRPSSPDIDEILAWCVKYKIRTMVPFIAGLPNETENDFKIMLEKVQNLKKLSIHSEVYPVIFSYLYIPGSPLFNNPDKFGIKIKYWDDETANIYKPLTHIIEQTPRYYTGVEPELFKSRVKTIRGIIDD